MGRTRSLLWAYNQFLNRSLHGISYKYDLGLAKPIRIGFSLTRRCNARCRHCAFWKMSDKAELTTGEWEQIITNFRKWLGRCRILFTGGEPLLREDLLKLIHFSAKNNIIAGIATNGIAIDDALARRIVDSGTAFLNVSLDGIRPETHDYIRGVEGVFEKVVDTIRYISEIRDKMSVIIMTVITGYNLDEIVELVEWVDKNDLDGILFQPLVPAADEEAGWYNRSKLWIKDYQKLDYVLDQLVAMKMKGARIINPSEQFELMKTYFRNPDLSYGIDCMVGVTNIGVSPVGDVYLCFKMPPIGNVKKMSLEKIWNSGKAKEARKAIKQCQLSCGPQNANIRTRMISDIIRFIKFT